MESRFHFTPWPFSELSGIAGQDPKIMLNTATMAVKGIAGPPFSHKSGPELLYINYTTQPGQGYRQNY